MALKSNGSTFLDDNRNYSSSSNTSIAHNAYILVANNDTVEEDGYSILGTKSIAEDGFGFNQFDMSTLTLSFSPTPIAQGSASGYTSGGDIGSLTYVDTIDKFPFAADANATDVGNLTFGRARIAGQSSLESGYTSGGLSYFGGFVYNNIIDKFPFATDANATDVGNLTQNKYYVSGQSSPSNGYISGGISSIPSPTSLNTIDKFPFSADANATDVGDLTQARNGPSGQSSLDSGYTSGGASPTYVNTIDKFPFSSDGNATDVGDLTGVRFKSSGQSSAVHGYASGGIAPPSVDIIDKFPFSSDANATDVGNLTQAKNGTAGQSSFDSGYNSGGSASAGDVNVIDKFPFSSDANATDVGDLSQTRPDAAGQQI